MTTLLSVPTVGATAGLGAGMSWRPSTAPTGAYALGTGLSGVAGVGCIAATPVARLAFAADLAALPFGAAATTVETTPVMAVAGNQQVAVAPKQAKNLAHNHNSMRKNASPHGTRAGAPPS